MRTVVGDMGNINRPVSYRAYELVEVQRGRGMPASAMFIALDVLVGSALARWLNRCWWPRQRRETVRECIAALETLFMLKGFDPKTRVFVDRRSYDEAQRRFHDLAHATILTLAAHLEGVACDTKTKRRVTL